MKLSTILKKQIHVIGTTVFLILTMATVANYYVSGHFVRFSIMEHFASYEVPALKVHIAASLTWAIGSAVIIASPKSGYHRPIGRTISISCIVMAASGMNMSFSTLAHMDIKLIIDMFVNGDMKGLNWNNKALHLIVHTWSNLEIAAIAMCLLGLAIANARLKDIRMHRNYFKTLNLWLAFNSAPRIVSFLLRLIAPSVPKYQIYSVAIIIHYFMECSGILPYWCMHLASVPISDQRSIRLQFYFAYVKTGCVNMISLFVLWHYREAYPASQIDYMIVVTSACATVYLCLNGYISAFNKSNKLVHHLFVGAPFAFTSLHVARWIPSHFMMPVAIYGFWVVVFASWWIIDFPHRFTRASPNCPSHLGLPKPAARAGSISNESSKCPFERLAQSASGGASVCPFVNMSNNHRSEEDVTFSSSRRRDKGKRERAPRIDMDHIYLSFADFMSTVVLIIPSSFVSFMKVSYECQSIELDDCIHCSHNCFLFAQKGFGSMYIRRLLQRWGLLHDTRLSDSQATKFVYKMFTTTPSLPPYLSSIVDDEKGDEIAFYVLESIPLVRNCGELYTGTLRVQISLGRKEMIDAKLDGRSLNARETFTIVSFFIINSSHANIHGLSNWGIGVNEKTIDEAIWNGKVSIIYNWLGYTIFPRFVLPLLCWTGVLSTKIKEWRPIFDMGMHNGVPQHGHLVKLAKHSHIVSFMLKLRVLFEKEFKNFRHDFPEVDSAEGLFLCTIVHSLDHYMLSEYGHLWADETHPEFGGMAELVHLSRSAFVDDFYPLIPG